MLQEWKSFAVDSIQKMLLRLLIRFWPMWFFFFFPRRTLFWLKLGTFQFAFLRPVLMFLSIVLWTNGNYTFYNVSRYFNRRWSTKSIGFRVDVSILAYNQTVKSGSTSKWVLTVFFWDTEACNFCLPPDSPFPGFSWKETGHRGGLGIRSCSSMFPSLYG